MKKILVEICCGSIDDAVEAAAGGADRVELCSALFLGGLTPSLGTVLEAKARLKIPVMVMIRPRAGGFCYTEAEMSSMERDAELAHANGADGLVFGVLRPDGTIDVQRCRRILARVGHQQKVFHRAFDVTPDPLAALNQLIDLGFTRILTSGQQDAAPDGTELIRRLIDEADKKIEILPGGGIRPAYIAEIVRQTGCEQVHLTAFKSLADTSTHARPAVTFGGALQPREDQFQMTDRDLVRKIISSTHSS